MIDSRNPRYLPAPAWKRRLFAPVLGWLTFHANRRFRTETWYAIKDMVLAQYGTVDGCDMQVLPPPKCWSCNNGVPLRIEENDRGDGRCAHCDGKGNYAPERYVLLSRIKLGKYVFHKPGISARRWHSPEMMMKGGGEPWSAVIVYDAAYYAKLWQVRSIIHGLITHAPTKRGKWLGYRTRIVLELLFDFERFAPVLLKRWTWKPRNWYTEQGRLWRFGCHPLQQPRFSPWHRTANWAALQDDDLPF
jgi:hypothetical protein